MNDRLCDEHYDERVSQIIEYVNELKFKKAKAYKQKAMVIICEQKKPFITNYYEKYVDPS